METLSYPQVYAFARGLQNASRAVNMVLAIVEDDEVVSPSWISSNGETMKVMVDTTFLRGVLKISVKD